MPCVDDGTGCHSISLTHEFLRIKVVDEQLQNQRACFMHSIEKWLSHRDAHLQQAAAAANAFAEDTGGEAGAAENAFAEDTGGNLRLSGDATSNPDKQTSNQSKTASFVDAYSDDEDNKGEVDGEQVVSIQTIKEVLAKEGENNEDPLRTNSREDFESFDNPLGKNPGKGLSWEAAASRSKSTYTVHTVVSSFAPSPSVPVDHSGTTAPGEARTYNSQILSTQSLDSGSAGRSRRMEQYSKDEDFEQDYKDVAEFVSKISTKEEEEIKEPTFLESKQACVGRFIGHTCTETIISFLILANAIVVGQEVDWAVSHPGEDSPFSFVVLGHAFNFIFMLEVVARMFAFGRQFVLGDQVWWNLFDTILVVFSFLEILLSELLHHSGNVSSLRVIRLVRIARIVRVIRVTRIMKLLIALRLLIVQILSTLRACFWAIVLLVLVLYVFGMIFAQVTSEHIADNPNNKALVQYWGTVPRAMYTLYKSVTGGVDWENVADELAKIHWVWVAVFNLYLAFTVFAVLNVVVGVFCQVAIESAAHDYENIIRLKTTENETFGRQVKRLFADIDQSGDGKITYHELKSMLDKAEVRAYFEHLGLDAGDAWDLFKILDQDESSYINLDEFTTGCLRLKGPAKVIDVEKLQYENKHMRRRLWAFMKQTEQGVSQIKGAISRVENAAPTYLQSPVFSRSMNNLHSPALSRETTASVSPLKKARVAVYI